MTTATPAPSMSASLRIRLSLMMFLQYSIWGAWLPFLFSFLKDHRGMDPASEIGLMFSAGAVGAVLGPFIAGQIADRYFNTEKYLALSHLLGAALIWQLATIDSFGAFLAFSVVYGCLYAPTMSLTNALAFHHLPDRDRDFGPVRLWGTIGWIAAGLAMGHWLLFKHTPEGTDEVVLAAQAAGKADAFRLSALLGLAMAVLCVFLPKTPPAKNSESSAIGAAFAAVKTQPLLTLFLLSIPVSCIHQLFFVHADGFLGAKQLAAPDWMKSVFGAGGGGLMTIGQMSEVIVLALMPLVIRSLSRKTVLAIGLVAYAARMALFAYVDSIPADPFLVLVTALALHGIIFGCFIFLAFIILDEETGADIRASVQNLYNLVIVGIGVMIGSPISGWLYETVDGDYSRLFSVTMWASLACLIPLLLFYPNKRRNAA